jgi:hypothetical protein
MIVVARFLLRYFLRTRQRPALFLRPSVYSAFARRDVSRNLSAAENRLQLVAFQRLTHGHAVRESVAVR